MRGGGYWKTRYWRCKGCKQAFKHWDREGGQPGHWIAFHDIRETTTGDRYHAYSYALCGKEGEGHIVGAAACLSCSIHYRVHGHLPGRAYNECHDRKKEER